MQVLVTGGAGFLGARLISALLAAKDAGNPRLPAFDRIVSLDLAPCPVDDSRVVSEIGNITERAMVDRLVSADTSMLFHLAAVVSSQAEAEFETGFEVNLDGTRNLLEVCRLRAERPFVFFSSSLAVFGPDCPPIVRDDQVLRPQSSYGTQKAMGELLVADYSRKGFIDGISARLPTVVIRPGKPNAAASSFASSILREPISGKRAFCKVAHDLPLWISSPDRVIENIVALAAMAPERRNLPSINLPGITVTPGDMIDALRETHGAEIAALVEIAPDPSIEAIVGSWPSRFDTTNALDRNLRGDRDLGEVIANYRRAYGR